MASTESEVENYSVAMVRPLLPGSSIESAVIGVKVRIKVKDQGSVTCLLCSEVSGYVLVRA